MVSQLLDDKGRKVWSIGPDASLFEALTLMADKDIGALLVIEGEKPVGLISERDYARKVILKGPTWKEPKVRDIMTTRVAYARPDQRVEECMAIVTERRQRHLPVFEQGEVVGLISIGDLVKAIMDDQQFVIEQLEDYISR